MGHPIHKHMSSGQRYDDKQAYNKKLSSKARLHYLENEEHDKGLSRYKEGMSRHTSEHSTEEYMDRKDAAIKKAKGMSRKSSPANNYVDPAEAVMAGAKDTREGAGGMSRSCKYKK